MRHARQAFTLIEVLVVVSIIVVLISITLPFVNKSREQARLAQCLSNQHQVYIALEDFCHNNVEACPGACGVISPSGPGTTPYYGVGQLISTSDSLTQTKLEMTSQSVLILRGHLKDSSTFHCPQQDIFAALQLQYTSSPATFHYVFSDFFVGDVACNIGAITSASTFRPLYSSRFPTVQTAPSPVTFNRSRDPSRCVLITEDGMLQDWTQSYMQNTIPNYTHATPWHALRPHKTHDRQPFIVADGAVCTYLDGHTEMVYVVIKDGISNYCVPTDQAGLPH
jgi:prepilin-type N-terminal cleavage/methylation domain-containing protein